MTTMERAITATEIATPKRQLGTISWKWLVTTDHKVIGNLYFITSMLFFLFGGILALAIRAELAFPGLQYLSYETYNQFFTMHGTIMLLLFATPLFAGFANAIMPLQIGSPDVAFPRLNMLSYWLYLFGGLVTVSGFLSPSGAASAGWFMYAPLSDAVNSPGVGTDLWIMGLYMAGLGTILGSVNFITTILCMRAPGMTMFRMPIFTWNILVTSILVLIAFPILAAALLVLEADRTLGAHVFDAANGGPILWQHLFWFFGHPEVYIIALPFFGIITEILPVFSRKPIFGYVGLVGATLMIAALSVAVWAHHMYVTGAVNLPFFSFMTFLIAVPDRGEVLQLDRHDVGRQHRHANADALGGRLPDHLPVRWSDRRRAGQPAAGLRAVGLLLRGRALPLRGVRDRGVRDVRRLLLLVAQVHRQGCSTRRWARSTSGCCSSASTPPSWSSTGWASRACRVATPTTCRNEGFTVLEPGLLGRRVPARCVDAAVPLQRVEEPQRPDGEHRRPVGLGPFAGVGDLLPAAAAQLHLDPADPLRVARPSTCTTPRWRWPSTATPGRTGRSTTAGRRRRGHRPDRGAQGAGRRRVRRLTASPATTRTQPGPVTATARGGPEVKAEAWIFARLTLFFALVTPVYWVMSEEPTGTSALILTFFLVLMIALLPRAGVPADRPAAGGQEAR